MYDFLKTPQNTINEMEVLNLWNKLKEKIVTEIILIQKIKKISNQTRKIKIVNKT